MSATSTSRKFSNRLAGHGGAFRAAAVMAAWIASAACSTQLLAQGGGPFPTAQELISTNPDNAASNGVSTEPTISADGGFVAFQSDGTDLSPADGDRLPDVYLRDMKSGRVALISTGGPFIPGVPSPKGNGASTFPSVSQAGRFVLFASAATNLGPRDENGKISDIYLHEVSSGKNSLVSVSGKGLPGDGTSDRGVISASARVAAFQSKASNLATPNAGNAFYRIHVSNIAMGEITRIDPPGGASPDGDSRLPRIDAMGDRIVFESAASNLVVGDTNNASDVFIFDRATEQITLVSVGDRRQQGNQASGNPRISANGRFVSFESLASNLVGNDTNKLPDVFVRDLSTGRTERISVDSTGAELKLGGLVSGISGDGRFAAFSTRSTLFPIDGNQSEDLHVRDRILGRTLLVSVTLANGAPHAANGPSRNGDVSEDGQHAAFESNATDLSRFDPAERTDIYRATIPLPLHGPFRPSNNVLVHIDGVIRQFDLAGRPTGRVASFNRQPARAIAVDDANALWVLGEFYLARYEAQSLEPAQAAPAIPVQIGGKVFHGLVAEGGFAWAAIDERILRFSAEGEQLAFSLPGRRGQAPIERVSIALSPWGHLWVCVGRQGESEFLKLSRSLELLSVQRRRTKLFYAQIACDADGSLFARSSGELAKISASGGLLWSRELDKGSGLAVDWDGSAFTVAGDFVLGFESSGRPFLEGKNPRLGQGEALVAMAVDGLGAVYLTEEGATSVFTFTRGTSPTVAVRSFASGDVGEQGGDFTGFIAADVSAQDVDSDDDGFLNRQETREHFNPFDPASPQATKRFPPLLDLTATVIGKGQVRLEWRSVKLHDRFFVFRDGRQIAGSPFPFETAFRGIVDTKVPGGLHVYRVVGQGEAGRGAGGGFSGDEVPEPFTLSQEASVSQGEGSVLDTASTPSPPDAVAFDSVASRVFVSLAGGTLWTLDANLELLNEATLPADPFASSEVRGMAVDTVDASRPLYFLLGDGRMFRRVGVANPVELAPLSGYPALDDGYTGLALASGNGNDIFAVMAGPGVDCLIGFLRSTGAFKPGNEQSVSAIISTPLEFSQGVSRIGNAFLAGVGIHLEGAPPAINRVVKIDLGGNFALTDAGASVSVEALGSSDIPSFDYAAGLGLFVADRSGSRVALLEAQFPGSLQILSVTPSQSLRNATTPNVSIAGTGFGADASVLQVKLDGFDAPIKSLAGGVIKVDMPPLGEARAVAVEVSSTTTSDVLFPGFTYGFRRGDSNDDGIVAMSDAIFTLGALFTGGSLPACLDAADSDDSEKVDISDAIYLLSYLFLGTKPQPPPPFSTPGLDPAGDLLDCGE